MDYYESLKDELLAKRNVVRSLTRQSKVQGDYHEALIRDFVERFIPQGYEVGHGIIFDDNMKKSRECDVIIYSIKERRPLFKSQDMIMVNAKDVRIVMQVKSRLYSKTLKESISNLSAVKILNRNILGWVVGFETNTLLKTLYYNAWKSRTVQFVHVFESKCKTENETLIESQMKFFVDLLRLYTQSGSGSTEALVIYDGDYGGRRTGWIALHEPREGYEFEKEAERVKNTLNNIYQKGFWNLWNSDYKVNP
jgi:hypothetical protein